MVGRQVSALHARPPERAARAQPRGAAGLAVAVGEVGARAGRPSRSPCSSPISSASARGRWGRRRRRGRAAAGGRVSSRAPCADHEGPIVKRLGDGVMAAFASASPRCARARRAARAPGRRGRRPPPADARRGPRGPAAPHRGRLPRRRRQHRRPRGSGGAGGEVLVTAETCEQLPAGDFEWAARSAEGGGRAEGISGSSGSGGLASGRTG